MFQKTTLLLVFVALASCNNNANKNEKIKASQWLLGKWTQQSEQGILEETWASVNDSTFEGTSYFIKGKDTLHNETIVLQQNGPHFIYKATIKGQNNDQTIAFPLTSATDKNLVFENPKHDYPQKITYQLTNDSTLIAKISGIQAGKPSAETYTLKKTE
jgi:hypothetical protein